MIEETIRKIAETCIDTPELRDTLTDIALTLTSTAEKIEITKTSTLILRYRPDYINLGITRLVNKILQHTQTKNINITVTPTPDSLLTVTLETETEKVTIECTKTETKKRHLKVTPIIKIRIRKKKTK